MGKLDEIQLPAQQQPVVDETHGIFFCQRCSTWLSRIFHQFSFKCFFILLLSFAVFFSTLFLILPLHSNHSGFDANSSIKQTAIVHAYFKLGKPVSELIPEIATLEYDINGEIGVPHTKVVVLSIHQPGASNWTDVVFGFLPDPVNAPTDPVALAVLKPSLIDLFLQQINLTLTNSNFGQPSSFEILEFPGGVSIIPKHSLFLKGQIIFKFTLNNSMSEVNENILQLSEQLKIGLHLMPDENVYVLLTNKNGSTRDPPITVEASIASFSGSLSPERLRQLAENITSSPPGKNLGLNNTVFGKVKEVRLSSYLNQTIDVSPPSSSPSPSPMQNDYPGPSPTPYASVSPSHSPSPSASFPHQSVSPSHSPSPSASFPHPPDGELPQSPGSEPPFLGSPKPMPGRCVNQLHPSPSPIPCAPLSPPPASSPSTDGLASHMSPAPSPILAPSYGSDRRRPKASEALPFTSNAPSQPFFHKRSWWFCFVGVMVFNLQWLDPLMWC